MSDSYKQDLLFKKKLAQDSSIGIHNATADSFGQNTPVRPLEPKELIERLDLVLPNEGLGKGGLMDILNRILQYSVNTWHQGFLHKLYATTNPIGVVSELILAVLNTNVSICSTRSLVSFKSLFLYLRDDRY